jgi:hypothetical protein
MTVGNGGSVTIRELYAQIGSLRTEMNVRLDKIEETLDVRFDAHKLEHSVETSRKNSYIRWAVTSVISVVGVGVAIVIPLMR